MHTLDITSTYYESVKMDGDVETETRTSNQISELARK